MGTATPGSYHRGEGLRAQLNKKSIASMLPGAHWHPLEAAHSLPSQASASSLSARGNLGTGTAPAAGKFLESPVEWMSFLYCE